MTGITASQKVKKKLKDKHQLSLREVNECFANRAGKFLFDRRVEHKTDPPTRWFISETDHGRIVKVVFIYHKDKNEFELKTAFTPEDYDKSIEIYKRFG